MGRNKGKEVRLVASSKALKMMGYKSQTSLDQFHADEGFTAYYIEGGQGRGGIRLAWSKDEIKKWLKTEGRRTEEWLID